MSLLRKIYLPFLCEMGQAGSGGKEKKHLRQKKIAHANVQRLVILKALNTQLYISHHSLIL